MASINRSDVVVFLVEIILVIWTRMCAKYLSEIFLGQGKCLFKSAIMKSLLNVIYYPTQTEVITTDYVLQNLIALVAVG